jgi:hypothetical protein
MSSWTQQVDVIKHQRYGVIYFISDMLATIHVEYYGADAELGCLAPSCEEFTMVPAANGDDVNMSAVQSTPCRILYV